MRTFVRRANNIQGTAARCCLLGNPEEVGGSWTDNSEPTYFWSFAFWSEALIHLKLSIPGGFHWAGWSISLEQSLAFYTCLRFIYEMNIGLNHAGLFFPFFLTPTPLYDHVSCPMHQRNLCPLITENVYLLILVLSTELSFLPHPCFYVRNLTSVGLSPWCWLRDFRDMEAQDIVLDEAIWWRCKLNR